jgi:Rap1a immunity proteins
VNRIICIVIVVALALAVTSASAADDDQSANFIMPGCKAAIAYDPPSQAKPAMLAGLCLGLVIGMRFALDKRMDSKFCADVPKGVTNGQLVRVVVRYIEMRPQEMHGPFMGLTVLALMDAWPCRK